MFKINKHIYHIIEIEKGSKLPELTADLKESLKAIGNFPAFQYLMLRFRNQKAGMETALREGMNLSESQLRYLQAGIYWSGQIERDIKSLTQPALPQPTPATNVEAAAFEQARQSLNLVG